MRSHHLSRVLSVLALLGVCLWTGMPSFGAEAPEPLVEHRSWLDELTAGQADEVQGILAEYRSRLAPLAGQPGAVEAMRELQRETLERLETILTPEQIAKFRASMPTFFLRERLLGSPATRERAGAVVAAATSPAACSDAYAAISEGRLDTEVACSNGTCDYTGHADHNNASVNDSLLNCQTRDDAKRAEELAYLALSDCAYADDAASAAVTAADGAELGAAAAQASFAICLNRGDYNACAANASAAAGDAETMLRAGATAASKCASCCFTLAAPTGLHATATNATTIRLTWQDRNTKETNTKIERNSNGMGFQEVYMVGVDVTLKADGSAPSTAGHRYRLRAYNSTCNLYSPYSAQALVPKAPTDLTGIKGTGTQFILNWRDRSGDINESGFEIQRRVGTGTWSLLAPVEADKTTYPAALVTGVNRFRVRAFTSTGESWYTNEVSYTY